MYNILKLNKLIPFFILFMYEVFFILSEIIGYNHERSENSPIYYIYLLLMIALTILILSKDLLINNQKLTKKNIIVLFIPVFIITSFMFDILFNRVSPLSFSHFVYFLIWPITSIFMGVYLSKDARYKNVSYFLDLILILINISLVRSIFNSIINQVGVNIGGATYQTAGYIFAIAFGINLFLIVFGEKLNRFRFTKSNIYKIINIIFLGIQVYGIIASGARGAILLLLLYILLIMFITLRNKKKFIFFLSILFVFILLLIMTWPIISQIPIIENSLGRIFSYIGPEGINWGNTSGRNVIYINTLKLISQSPIFGYGFFNAFTVLGESPHNLFLEVLLQGGILLFTAVTLLIVYLLYKIIILYKSNKYFALYMVLFCYPFINLLFSGTYLSSSLFWFMVSFIISLNINSTIDLNK